MYWFKECTDGFKNTSQRGKYWETDIKNQPIGILKSIKEIIHNYQYSQYPITSIFKAIKIMVDIKQDKKESLAAFTKIFNNSKDCM